MVGVRLRGRVLHSHAAASVINAVILTGLHSSPAAVLILENGKYRLKSRRR